MKLYLQVNYIKKNYIPIDETLRNEISVDLAEFEESVISAVADMLNGKEINVEHK